MDAVQAEGLKKTNLVISQSDADQLKKEDISSQVLRECRVIVIVNSPIGGVEGNILQYINLASVTK